MPWQALQRTRLDEQAVIREWGEDSPFGVAVICGEISGNLEMLELEAGWASADALFSIEQEMDAETLFHWATLLTEGYVEWTPSGGLHLIYRITDHNVPGNTKVAQGPDRKTRAETRGDGGYAIVAPTTGACHPSGEGWEAVNGGPELVRAISWDVRNAIHSAIKAALDDSPPPPPPKPARVLQLRPEGAITPGDDFAARTDWSVILGHAGWQLESNRGHERLWVRPGKDRKDGASASTDYQGKSGLYVWSTSAGLPTEEPLSKLYVYAHYNHNGDMRAAVKHLASKGFGTPLAARLRDDTFMGDEPSTEVALVGDMEVASTGTDDTEPFEVPRMDDARAAEFYIKHFPVGIAYVPEKKMWMFYEDGVWRADSDDNRVKRAVTDIAMKIADAADNSTDKKYRTWAKNAPNATRVNAAVQMMRYFAPVYADQFDKDRNLLNLENGTLDLTSLELLPHNPADHLTKKMGAAFNPDKACDRWKKYLDEVLPDEATQDFLQRMVGYTMLGKPVERAMAVLHGPGGTGKSRFIEIISSLMGTYGTTAAPSLFVSKFEGRGTSGPNPDLNDLEGARMASMSELDRGVRMDESLVKRLTGLDRITSRSLYQENRTWMPRCVIWIASNHPIKVDSDDGAIWDRLKVIPFVQQITTKDPHILEKLMEESDGILNWMIEGVQKYRERGLVEAPQVVTAVEQYRADQDTVREFIKTALEEGQLVVNEAGWVKPGEVFEMYLTFCRSEHYTPFGKKRFYARLDDHLLPYHVMRWRSPGQTHPVYNGIMKPAGAWLAGTVS